jgi:hypothetical protein
MGGRRPRTSLRPGSRGLVRPPALRTTGTTGEIRDWFNRAVGPPPGVTYPLSNDSLVNERPPHRAAARGAAEPRARPRIHRRPPYPIQPRQPAARLPFLTHGRGLCWRVFPDNTMSRCFDSAASSGLKARLRRSDRLPHRVSQRRGRDSITAILDHGLSRSQATWTRSSSPPSRPRARRKGSCPCVLTRSPRPPPGGTS